MYFKVIFFIFSGRAKQLLRSMENCVTSVHIPCHVGRCIADPIVTSFAGQMTDASIKKFDSLEAKMCENKESRLLLFNKTFRKSSK